MARQGNEAGQTVVGVGAQTTGDGPDVEIGKRLLDLAKHQGFIFQRVASGPDAPLWAVRESNDWVDTIYLGGFWEPDSCSATRSRKSSLVIPGGLAVTERVSGDALNVLNTVVTLWPPDPADSSLFPELDDNGF